MPLEETKFNFNGLDHPITPTVEFHTSETWFLVGDGSALCSALNDKQACAYISIIYV